MLIIWKLYHQSLFNPPPDFTTTGRAQTFQGEQHQGYLQPGFVQQGGPFAPQAPHYPVQHYLQSPPPVGPASQAYLGAYTTTFAGPVGSGRGGRHSQKLGDFCGNVNIGMTISGPQPPSRPLPSGTRGPPRKPKQSEFSLWVGSLPAGVRIEDVRDHFSQGAKEDIVSVFLMKSNSAFVNYRTREATISAVQRFDGSRMSSGPLPLKCKVRDPINERQSSVPTGPAAQTTALEAIQHNREVSARAVDASKPGAMGSTSPNKYFIMKSLTKEDLDTSVRDGVWATQPHNEDGLNRAFEVSSPIPSSYISDTYLWPP